MARMKTRPKVCEVCKKEFFGWRQTQRFCSLKCRAKWQSIHLEGKFHKKKITLECRYCHHKFQVLPFQKNRIFCSTDCCCKDHDYHSEKMRGKNNPNYGKSKKIKKVCEVCSKEFWVIPTYGRAKYCSRKCYGIAKIGKDFAHQKGTKFSLKRRKEISKRIKGKCNPNWKGGITPKRDLVRNQLEFKLWRKAVFTRDNYTCQKCGQHGWHLNAHHIKNFAEFIELRTSIKNGITFCKNCHDEFHRMFGKKGNNEKQVRKYLKYKEKYEI